MAEFRQEWVTAVSQYQTAYSALKGVPLGQPQPSVQRHAEVRQMEGFYTTFFKGITLGSRWLWRVLISQ